MNSDILETIIVGLVVGTPVIAFLIRSPTLFDRYSLLWMIVFCLFVQLAGGGLSDQWLGIGAFPGWFASWVLLIFLAVWYPVYRSNRDGRKAAEARAAEALAQQAAGADKEKRE